MRILITGGAGFIGSHTADALAKKGHKIIILDNIEPPVHNRKWPVYLSKNYELIKGSVTKKEDWLKTLKDVDVVYSLAAYQDQLPNFSKFFDVNVNGVARFFEVIVANKMPIKKFIFASTQFVYGDGQYERQEAKYQRLGSFFPGFRSLEQLEKGEWNIKGKFIHFKEDQQLMPPNAYALSKVAKESLSFTFGKRYEIPTVGMRYSIVQGPRQSPRNAYSGALRIFTTQALSERDITVYEDGYQLRDFVNIKDIVEANLLVLENSKADYQVFNVGGGRAYSVLEFAKMVKKITDSNSKITIDGNFRWGDTRNAVSDISKLKKLGWKPKFTPENSIKDYVKWLKEEWEGRFDFSDNAQNKMKKMNVIKSSKTS